VTRVAFFSCADSRHKSRCARRRRRAGAGDTDLAADDQNGIIGRMWFTGIPVVLDRCAEDGPVMGRSAAAARMDAALAVPFILADQSKAVIAWYF
jgi:hypothetical protein